MPHPRRWWTLGVLCTVLLVISVDNMILNLAVPTLMRDLGSTPADVQWILDAYILVFAGFLITAGSLSDRFGRRRFLIMGLTILGTASVLATLAEQPWHLVACRALMGLGAAFAMPSTKSILIAVFDESERRKAMAAWSVVGMVGIVAGPVLGGLLLQHFRWSAVFFINVPLAVIGILAAYAIVPESRGPARPSDPLGVALSITGMATLVWAIISLPHAGWSASVAAALAVAVLALVAFAVWESRSRHPMLPLTMFGNRDFSGASLSAALLMFATGAVQLALTQYLQQVLGFDTMTAAFALAPLALAVALFNVVGATLAKRLSNKTLVVSGMLVIAAGFWILSLIGPGNGYLPLTLSLVVVGVGTGLATPGAYAVLMNAIPPERGGVGSAVNDTIQQGGMALGVAALGGILSAAYSAALPPHVPNAARTSLTDALSTATATGSAELANTAREAFVSAMSMVCLTAACLSVAGAVFALATLRNPSRTPALPRQPDGATAR
ncbi:MFS transporter [Nonomuraea sp. H19]|uniref:MFS transporter n=1 Tax=Nonomuraea sp. H19 TaxID=3452206 RepID=UPI003F8ACF93